MPDYFDTFDYFGLLVYLNWCVLAPFWTHFGPVLATFFEPVFGSVLGLRPPIYQR